MRNANIVSVSNNECNSMTVDSKFENSGFGRSVVSSGEKQPVKIYRPEKKPLPPLVDLLICNAQQFAIGNE